MDKRQSSRFGALFAGNKSEKKHFRRMIISLISIVIVIAAMTTSTISWFTTTHSQLEATRFQLECGKGLRVNDSGTSEMQFSQVDNYLTPASSVDGRNLYFPTDGNDFSNVTSQMTFRSANVGDKNVNYIQIDFSLTAQQNHTALYINDEKTSIKVANSLEPGATHRPEDWSIPQAAALRAALWSSTAENGIPNTPIVFNPTNSTVRTAAVADVDRSTGAFVGDGRQVAHAFSEYAFGGSPVATLSKGVETKFSYIIWLEGTDPKCTDKILSKDIQINLAFTTSWDKTQTIRFKDETRAENGYEANWVTTKIRNEKYSLMLHYEDANQGSVTDFNMYDYIDENHGEWMCNIPGDMVNKISFILRPPSGTNKPTYAFTMSSKVSEANTYNRGANRQYIAELSSTTTDTTKCRGYWKAIGDSDGAGHDSGGSFDGDDF